MLLEALAVVDTCVMHSAAALSPVKSSTVLAKARPHSVFVGVTWWVWPHGRYMGVICKTRVSRDSDSFLQHSP